MALTEEDKKEILKMIREETPKVIESLFSRTLRQLREFFISNIN